MSHVETSPGYDREAHLDSITRFRSRRDQATRVAVEFGDRLANALTEGMDPEDYEPAGSVIMRASGSLAALIVTDSGRKVEDLTDGDTYYLDPAAQSDLIYGTLLVNILGLAGEKLVRDGRAIELATRNDGGGAPR